MDLEGVCRSMRPVPFRSPDKVGSPTLPANSYSKTLEAGSLRPHLARNHLATLRSLHPIWSSPTMDKFKPPRVETDPLEQFPLTSRTQHSRPVGELRAVAVWILETGCLSVTGRAEQSISQLRTLSVPQVKAAA